MNENTIQSQSIWDEQSGLQNFTTPNRAELLEELNINKSSKILDLGCGYGRTLKMLWKLGYKNILGIDYSDGMLNIAKESIPNISFYNCKIPKELPDIRNLDVVFFLTVANSIISDLDLNKIFEFVNNNMNNNGVFIFDDYVLSEDNNYKNRYLLGLNEFNNYGLFRSNGNEVFKHRPKVIFDSLFKEFFTIEKCTINEEKSMNNRKTSLIHYILRKK